MKFVISLFCVLAVLLSAPITGFQSDLIAQTKPKAKSGQKEKAKTKVEYLCPNHPEVTSSVPGTCRICKLSLEKQETPKSLSPTGEPGEIAALAKEVKGYKIDVLLTPSPPLPGPDGTINTKDPVNYRVDVTVKKSKAKSNIKNAEVWFHIVYPNGRNLMPRLTQRDEGYVGEFHLPTTGPYTFMVHANMASGNIEATFKKVMH